MFAGEWNVLSRPNNKVVGPNGVLMGTEGGAGIISPTALDGLALWLDAIDQNNLLASDGSVIEDGEAVALWSDKSGNSVANAYVSGTAAGNYLSASNKSVTGNQTFTLDIALSDYTPASDVTVVNKLSGNDGFKILVLTTGVVRLQIGDGASVTDVDSSAAFTMTDLARYTVRIDWEDGVGATFAQDGVAVGSPVSAVKTLTNAAVDCVVGTVAGVIYRAQVGSVYDCNPALANKLATSFSSGGDTWTITTTGATGARISGARDLYQGTVANRPVFLKYNGEKYGYLNGVSGNYFSTPDSAALDITGDIDLRAEIAPQSWTPSSNQTALSKIRTSTDNRSYALQISATTGYVRMAYSTDGTSATVVIAESTVTTGFSAYTKHWIRVTRNATTGDVNFYTSSDGDSWTQLGATVSTTPATLYSGTALLEVGTTSDGTAGFLVGKVYKAQVYSGIAGTLVANFDASQYSSGSNFTASTGETWSLNSGSHIVQRTGLYFDGSNDYLKSASFSLSQPETAYVVGNQITWASGDYVIDGNATNSLGAAQTTSSPRISMSAGSLVAENSDWTLKTAAVVSSVFNGASSQIRVNRGTATTGNAGAANASGFTLGAIGAGTTNYGNVFISEVPVYSTAQDTATQDRVALYAGKKWKFAV